MHTTRVPVIVAWYVDANKKLTISLLSNFITFMVTSLGHSPGHTPYKHRQTVSDITEWSDGSRAWCGEGESNVRLVVTIENVKENQMDVISDKCLGHLVGHYTKCLSTMYSLWRGSGGGGGERERNKDKR